MNKTATILLTLLFVTPLFAINASASNESGEQTYEDFVIEYHPLPTNAVVMDQEEFEYKEQICGYRDTNNDGISDLRGNCESSSFIAPNDRWFQYQIPLSADGSWPGFGDYVRFYVDNNGEPNNWGNNEDCVQFTINGRWNDAFCGQRLMFFCEDPR